MYKKMYLLVFNAMTDAQRLLAEGKVEEAVKKLMDAQCEAEEIYLSAEDEEDGETAEGNAMVIMPSQLEEEEKSKQFHYPPLVDPLLYLE